MSGSEKDGSGQRQPNNKRGSASSTKRTREATVYDAVAGRVSTQRFIPDAPATSTTRDTATSSALPTPPDEVLFRRAGAPVRYEETDIYWSNRYLEEDQVLPDTDLLKAVHTYASDFYRKAFVTQREVSFGSMDETALLAMGILLEEAAEHILGETGDLVFVEGEESSTSEEEVCLEDFNLKDLAEEREEAEPSSKNEQKEKRRRKKRKI